MSLLEQEIQELITAAEAGNAQAQCDLGFKLLQAAQSQADIDRAVTWLHRAAQRDHPDALFAMANLYLMRRAGMSDSDYINRALSWLLRAKELGHPEAGKFFQAIMTSLQANHAGEYSSEYDEIFAEEEYSAENGEDYDGDSDSGTPAADSEDDSGDSDDSGADDAASGVPERDYLIVDGKMLSNRQSLQTLADMGMPRAMAILGDFYLQGKDGPKDEQKGQEWLQKAADKDDSMAMLRLGSMYTQGSEAFAQDFGKARQYLFRAVASGSSEALLSLGEWYSHENNPSQDYRKAAQFFVKAKDAGILAAYARLAELYAQGLGVPQDDDKALELYTQGARLGDSPSQYGLALAYLNGKGTEPDLPRALKWLRQAAANGFAPAREQLQKLEPQDQPSEPAAAAPSPSPSGSTESSADPAAPAPPDLSSFAAMGQAAATLQARQRTTPDPVLELRAKHAEQSGEEMAACHMGVICEKARDWESARRWYAQAARQGQALGLYNLGVLWETGRGGKCDPRQAFSCYAQAAQQGYAKAQYNLCLMYARGQGTERSLELAREWCAKAAEQGLPEAQRLMEMLRKYTEQN